MKFIKFIFVLTFVISLNSCASTYKVVKPETINYRSQHKEQGVTLGYKYDVLEKKYKRKESKKDIKLVVVSVTNDSEKDIVFGQDAVVTFENGYEVKSYQPDQAFKMLKQSPASHLLYLLLTFVRLETSNGTSVNSYPIGFVLGPGIAGLNILISSSANKKFRQNLRDYNLDGVTIEKGATKRGIMAIQSDSFEGLKIKVK